LFSQFELEFCLSVQVTSQRLHLQHRQADVTGGGYHLLVEIFRLAQTAIAGGVGGVMLNTLVALEIPLQQESRQSEITSGE